jgi:hypothetical protein
LFKEVLMTGSNTEKEIAKLDPNGPDYDIFVEALKRFDGLTAEKLKMYVERRGLIVDLLPYKVTMTGSSVQRDVKAMRM